MKNKLKLTTALVGSLMAVGATSALAQNVTTYYDNGGKDGTTVSGNMYFSYRSQTANGGTYGNATGRAETFHGFGKEVQININNKGKLNNGWGYEAGFSIENDGNEWYRTSVNTSTNGSGGAGSGIFGENNFIDIMIGNTTLTVSQDHIQNPDANPTLMGGPSTYIRPFAAVSKNATGSGGIYPNDLNSPYESAGVGVIQNVPGIGSFSALYTPHRHAGSSNLAASGSDNGNTSAATDYNDAAGYGSAYEIGYVGDLGVSGLKVGAFWNKVNLSNTNGASESSNTLIPSGGLKSEKVNATYVLGSTGFTVAAEYAKAGIQTSSTNGFAANQTAAGSVKAASVGLSYAITKDFSIAGTYAQSGLNDAGTGTVKTSNALSGVKDEKVYILSAGYSLGPVALKGQFRNTDNVGGLHANGGEKDFLIWSGVNF